MKKYSLLTIQKIDDIFAFYIIAIRQTNYKYLVDDKL